MSETFDQAARRGIRAAVARDNYARDAVQLADPCLSGFRWLVASHRGLFAVDEHGCKTVAHGWFFGIERAGNYLYLFENCGMRDRDLPLGRIVRYTLTNDRLAEPVVLVKQLHGNAHQLRMIDGLLCLVDTALQRILRFTPDGALVDIRMPFPAADQADTTGAYRHVNSIAKVAGRIVLMCHNGKAVPDKQSELAWLDDDWQVERLEMLPGHFCHDIVPDADGVLWHSASREGDLIASDGRRIDISDCLMTRGLAFTGDRVILGLTTFGPRQLRDVLNGSAIILDRSFRKLAEIELDGAPTDIVAI